MGLFGTIRDWLTQLAQKTVGDELPTQSAALAFYTALSFAPLALLTLATLAQMGLSLQEQMLLEVQNLMGAGASQTLRDVVDYSRRHPEHTRAANIFGFATLLISASAMFGQLQSSLNQIFACPPTTSASSGWARDILNYLARRSLSIAVMLFFILFSIFSLLLSALLKMLIDTKIALVGQAIHSIGSFLVFTILFSGIFHWLPQRRARWQASLIGGFSAAGLFLIGRSLVGLYLERTTFDLAYGAAGSLIILLLWVYYSSVTLFLGAEIASVLDPHSKPEKEKSDESTKMRKLRKHVRQSIPGDYVRPGAQL